MVCFPFMIRTGSDKSHFWKKQGGQRHVNVSFSPLLQSHTSKCEVDDGRRGEDMKITGKETDMFPLLSRVFDIAEE